MTRRELLEKAYEWVFDNCPNEIENLGFIEGVVITLERALEKGLEI